MHVFRLCRASFVAIDGEGARLYGGRWNCPGRAVVYTSGSLSLAALEYLVHVPADIAPTDLVALTIEIPDDLLIESVDVTKLPPDWYDYLGDSACRSHGDAWIAAGTNAVLRVPAAPVPEEHNYLLSPAHAEAQRIRIVNQRPFQFDPRLLK